MNKDQRKYLLEAVQAQYRTEYDRLKERRPKEPSLNNYLVAAILDGSFTLKPEDDVRAAIAKRVRDLGRDEALVDSTDRRYTYSRRDGGTEDIVHLPALLLFDAPPQYAEALPETVGMLDSLVGHLRDYGGLQDMPAAHDGAQVVAWLSEELRKYQATTIDWASQKGVMALLPLSWYRGFFEWARANVHVVEMDVRGTDYPRYQGVTLFPVEGLRLPRMARDL